VSTRTRRLILGTAIAVAVTAGTAACTGPSAASGGSAGSSGSARPAATSAALTSQLPAATRDVAAISWDLPQGEPATIDPAQAADYSPDFIDSNLCDTLLRENPDFTISPNLATYKQVSPTRLVFTIRPGVKFWDGHPVTAADAVYSMDRIWKNTNAPANFLYEFVSGITAVGTQTVVVTFAKPDELFWKEMSSPSGMVIEKAYAQKTGAKLGTAQGGVMCSGPYELKAWQAGNSMTLVANDHYWNPALRPKVATVKVSFVTDTAALTAGLLSGEFNGAYELPAAVIPRLRATAAGRLTLGPSPQSLVLDVARPGGITANAGFTKALWVGIDRAAIAKAVFYGAAEPNYTDLAQSAWDPAAESMYSAAYQGYVQEYAYNPALAASLVKKSGYHGQPVTIAILSGNATQSSVAQIIQAELAQVGVKVSIDEMQPIQYSEAGYQASLRQNIDLLISTNYNQVADPLEFLGLGIQPGSVYNYTNYSNPAAWNDLVEARQVFNAQQRTKLILASQALQESARGATSLEDTDEVSFLSGNLTGAVTAFPYLFEPSLATIGGK
jgi:peptide/nickel transport system substrate-binding protein